MGHALDVRALARAAGTLSLDGELGLAPWLAELVETFGVRTATAYAPVPRDTHWDLTFCEWAGKDWEDRRDAYRRYMRALPADRAFASYDPFAVESVQRNVALDEQQLLALDARYRVSHRRIQAAIGATSENHQLRVLVCDGPRLLAWVGMWHTESFSAEQRDAFSALIAPLHHRLSQLGRITAGAHGAPALDLLLAQMHQAALLLRKNGQVEWVNRAAEDLLATSEGRAELAIVRAALRAKTDCNGYRLTPTSGHGMPGYVLALREDITIPPSIGVARAVQRWALSARAGRVLERACAGDSNKEIGVLLNCAEVTVERHITQLFRASGARSRTELVAKVLKLPL